MGCGREHTFTKENCVGHNPPVIGENLLPSPWILTYQKDSIVKTPGSLNHCCDSMTLWFLGGQAPSGTKQSKERLTQDYLSKMGFYFTQSIPKKHNGMKKMKNWV